ncbi:hypothetical protein SOVF_169710 [Spinacia oleracea]|uniref:Uncharacterized protein isoform X2 n=1 Tax=Spinacia oleracea TaxID=3562 RepID=A0A9R0JID0_SPIOL|nr:uncharacterized protein LOC110805765 isoform X2 [Spinacia oleracea]KNA07676.1 hypothetical protein SOVF_169710 [Spinacia oleracea]
MEIPPIEDSHSQPTPNSSDVGVPHNQDDLVPQVSDSNGNGASDPKVSAEEVKGVLEIIASTGKFWHEWDELKNMLLFQLKQVLSEYPETRIPTDQQNPSMGESRTQLVKSLEEALFSFLDGPPFTLQRLCEILLNAQNIYPNLSKLALALEKNLLVTSTLMKSTDPYPPSNVQLADASSEQVVDAQPLPAPLPQPETQPPPLREPEPEPETQPPPLCEPEPETQPPPLREPEPEPRHQPQPQPLPHIPALRESEPEPQPQPLCPPHSVSVENAVTGDRDEVMSEVDAEVDDGMTIDMETFEEIISSSENPK